MGGGGAIPASPGAGKPTGSPSAYQGVPGRRPWEHTTHRAAGGERGEGSVPPPNAGERIEAPLQTQHSPRTGSAQPEDRGGHRASQWCLPGPLRQRQPRGGGEGEAWRKEAQSRPGPVRRGGSRAAPGGPSDGGWEAAQSRPRSRRGTQSGKTGPPRTHRFLHGGSHVGLNYWPICGGGDPSYQLPRPGLGRPRLSHGGAPRSLGRARRPHPDRVGKTSTQITYEQEPPHLVLSA